MIHEIAACVWDGGIRRMSKKKALIPLDSKEELQKILFIQQSVTRAAKNEMLAMAIDTQEPEKFLSAAKALLAKYAKYPTLSEFAANPKLSNVYKWGATFGVTALVGALVIEECKTLHPALAPELRRIFLQLLMGLDQPGSEIKADTNAVESLIAVSIALGLAGRNKKRVVLTPVGKRVLRHLVDAARFIEEMTAAHAKLQSENKKP